MNDFIDYNGANLLGLNSAFLEILVPLLILFGIVVLALLFYRRYLKRRSHKKEYWLPIVDDTGNAIGRVARFVSFEKPHLYQHPLIRIVVRKSKSIYLSPRRSEICPDYQTYDHPFERMMRYGESVEHCINIYQKRHFPKSQRPQFALKYKHENAIGSWQVLLYILRVNDENELINMDKNKGKYWYMSQLHENRGMSCFSTLLEGELDFMKLILENID